MRNLTHTQNQIPPLSVYPVEENRKICSVGFKNDPNLTAFCILIFGLAEAQVINVAAELTERDSVLCWWSTSLHNQVGACDWFSPFSCIPLFFSFPCECFFFPKVSLLFQITWLVRECLPVFFVFCALFFFLTFGDLSSQPWKTSPAVIFYSEWKWIVMLRWYQDCFIEIVNKKCLV